MNFGKKCRELRIKKAVTQEQMATALNLSPQAVSKWENNLTLPDITLLPEISVYLGVTIDELFDLTDQKHFTRIRNMVILQETIDDNDFEYARSFLLSHMDDPKNQELCLQLLPALFNRKADEYRKKAEYYAKEALAYFPENHNNHANLNDAQQGVCGDWNLDNQADRIRYYKEFLTKHPDSVEGLQWYITELLHVGRLTEAAGAIDRLESLLHSCPDTVSFPLRPEIYRIKLLWEQGDHEKALNRLDTLTNNNSGDWRIWNFAGDIYAKACLYEKAITCYEQTLATQPVPRYTDASMAIAQICEITGDLQGAVNAWETYIRILTQDWNTPESISIDRAKQKIRELEKHI